MAATSANSLEQDSLEGTSSDEETLDEESVVAPRPVSTMNAADTARFKGVLDAKRIALVKSAQESLEQDMTLDTNELPDEVDLASSEYIQSFALRLRGRERMFLDKIDKALTKITDGEFGMCEDCEEPIGRKRLEARPETTLCIRCKEDQERAERDFR